MIDANGIPEMTDDNQKAQWVALAGLAAWGEAPDMVKSTCLRWRATLCLGDVS